MLTGGQTLEFAILFPPDNNAWNTSPAVMTYDIFDYNSGADIFGVEVVFVPFDSEIGTLQFWNKNMDFMYHETPANIFNQYYTYAIVTNFDNSLPPSFSETFSIYENGNRVYNTSSLFLPSPSLTGGVTLYSGSGLVIDNIRRSNIARYNDSTYEPFVVE